MSLRLTYFREVFFSFKKLNSLCECSESRDRSSASYRIFSFSVFELLNAVWWAFKASTKPTISF